MRLRFGGALLVLLLALLPSAAVWAQANTGAIAGRVTDTNHQPIPGASVTVTSKYVQGAKGAATNLDGEFMIPYLPPGNDYQLTVEGVGFNKVVQSNIIISLGSTTTLDIELMAGGEVIEVKGRPPVVTLKETKIETNLTQEELEMLPLTRSYQGALMLAPSVVASGAGGNPAVSGGTSTSNVWVINGLNTTDPVTGTFGSNLNFNFVREMEIDTAGMDAEYSSSTGGLFNVLTKSGTNEYHGEVFAYYTNNNMTANTHSSDFGVVKPQPFHEYDYGVDVGGPILKDRLWFFAAYNPQDNSFHSEGVGNLTYIYNNSSHPDWVGTTLQIPYKYDDYRRIWSWSTKFNYRLNDKHSLELAVFADPARMWDSEGGPGQGYSYSLYNETWRNRRYQGGYSAIARWYGTWTSNLFTEVSLGYADKTLQVQPWSMDQLAYRPVLSIDYDLGLYVTPGNASEFSMDDRKTNQVEMKATWILGKHELKIGGENDAQDWSAFYDYTGGQFVEVYENKKGTVPWSSNLGDYRYRWLLWYQNPRTDEKANYIAGFLQDKWSVQDNINIMLGVRYEKNELDPQNGVALKLDSWSPRLGLTWDWAKNGKSKFYVHWGRYDERPPIGFVTEMDGGHASYQARYSNYGQHHDYTVASGLIPAVPLPQADSEYLDEVLIGNSYELQPDLTLDVRYIYRDQGRVLEDVGWIDKSGNYRYYITNPADNYPHMNSWANIAHLPDYEKTPNPIHHYEAFSVSLNRRFSNHWYFNLNYTWSKLYGNYDADAYGYNAPGGATHAQPLFDVPEHILHMNQYGPLAGDRPHVIKAQGSYKFDMGLVLGGVFSFQSGRPMYHLMNYPALEQYGYGTIMMQPRTDATRMPSTWTLDVHAEYIFKIFKTDLGVFADIFNVTNNQAQTGYYSSYYITPDYRSDIFSGNLVRDSNWGKTTSRQGARYARLGLKWSF